MMYIIKAPLGIDRIVTVLSVDEFKEKKEHLGVLISPYCPYCKKEGKAIGIEFGHCHPMECTTFK